MKRIVLVAASSLMLAALAAAGSSSAAPAAECATARGVGQTQLNPANGRFEGTLQFALDGVTTPVLSSTEIVAQEFRGVVWFLTTSHRFTLPDGTVLTTLDNARLVPTPAAGVYRAVSNVEVVSGGSGFLVAVGTIDFTGLPTADWRLLTGRLCAA